VRDETVTTRRTEEAAMPFVVTTKRPDYADPGDLYREAPADPITVSRLAVATLEEAQQATADESVARGYEDLDEADAEILDRQYMQLRQNNGGEVGTLPDGSTIRVEPRGWEFFGWHHIEPPMPEQRAEILAAFNARER
jgi:hypothetical protein